MKRQRSALRLGLNLTKSTCTVLALGVVAARAEVAPTPESEVERLEEVAVNEFVLLPGGVGRIQDVTGTSIQAGRRTEVVLPDFLNANRALNLSRQIYAKIPGANLWENDGTGVQLGIGTRGLSPNRSWEFNVRQNGYDISSDVFGYPEAYYTPPTEAVERVDFVRGAAALQYGPQFGGLLNFHLKHGPTDRAVAVESRQTVGTYGLFNTYNSVGGTQGPARYYGAVQYRRGDGWRSFGDFEQGFALARGSFKLGSTLTLHADLTWFTYDQRQPGGLTDAQFALDPSQARRARNWFAVDWLVPALTLDWKPTTATQLSTEIFYVQGSRDSVGMTSGPDVTDSGTSARSVLLDAYDNYGVETRLRHDWEAFGAKHTLATGARAYLGLTDRAQGAGTTAADRDFTFTQPANLDNDFSFETRNLAAFAENLFRIDGGVTVTPGVRFEHIETVAEGTYRIGSGPARGAQDQSVSRLIVLPGVSLSWQAHPAVQVYGGVSAAYRPLQFNDVRVTNPVQATDPDATDSEGWVVEAGVRGSVGKWFRYDLGVFEVRTDDRFGTRAPTAAERLALGLPSTVTTLRTNVADARSRGFEGYAELDLVRIFEPDSPVGLSLFNTTALVEAEYTSGTLNGRRLELAPAAVHRTGLTLQAWKASATLQHSRTTKQYADANNTVVPNASGTVGLIPAYEVWDLSFRYQFNEGLGLEASVNNLLDEAYFTRRAGGYPGPGIVPSEGRTATLTVEVRF